ncbi:MAG: hypothetical protein ACXVO9_01735 [Bacteroidia bacterium]
MKIKLTIVLIGLLALLLITCKHKPNDDLAPLPGTPAITVATNPADSVCFSEQILPILASSCGKSGCHDDTAKTGGIVLTSYSSVKATISGNLLMQVIQDNGPLGMPLAPLPKLTAAQIALIQKWVNEGMKDGIDCQGPCDTTNITFSNTVFPILQNSCIGCHSTQAPIIQIYADVKTLVDNGKLLCTINHNTGCSPMPKNSAQLSACKIKQITKWVLAGAPNN